MYDIYIYIIYIYILYIIYISYIILILPPQSTFFGATAATASASWAPKIASKLEATAPSTWRSMDQDG